MKFCSTQFPRMHLCSYNLLFSSYKVELSSFVAKANPSFYSFSPTFLYHFYLYPGPFYSTYKYTFITSILNITHNKTTPILKSQPITSLKMLKLPFYLKFFQSYFCSSTFTKTPSVINTEY